MLGALGHVMGWTQCILEKNQITHGYATPCSLVLSGKVTMIDMKNKSITVDVVGRNSLGEHVTGEVTVRLLGNSND